MAALRVLRLQLGVALCLSAIACGGGGNSSSVGGPPPPPPPTSNVASVIADQGPTNSSVNTLFTSVKVCVPGSTTSCQTIDHVQVDTGSYGLRILAPILTLTLPVVTLAGGGSLAECVQFVDGYSWGPVASADMTIAGETASSVPVQLIGDSRFATVPAACSSAGGTQEDTVAAFGANGILGIGPFELDCADCDVTLHGLYYACAGTTCTDTLVPTNLQVPNPVTHFAADNNGSIIDLPVVPAAGEVTFTGSLIFGIDTQSNNQSGTQTVLTVSTLGDLTMTYNGQQPPLTNSFIDSGSNGIYFTDATIPTCTGMNLTTFYCPGATLSQGLSIQGANGVMVNNLTFGVGNAQTMLMDNPSFNVFPLLAGTNPTAGSFDYGLAFFYGKRVAVAVEGKTTSAGTGPYIAF
jgi:hypothetical protein